MNASRLARARILACALPLAAALAAAASGPAWGDALAEDAATIADQHGGAPAAVEQRLRAQQRGGDAAADAQRRWPQTYAGSWHDGSGGLVVAFTRDAARNAAAVGGGAHGVTRSRSFADLRARQARMIEDRNHASAGLLLLPGAEGGRYDIWIDEPANAIVVRLERGSAAAADAFRRRYGDDVVVQSGPIAAPDCNRNDCRYDLRAGLQVYSNDGACTSAFTVRRNYNDAKNLLSAAHCPSPWRHHGGQKYGEVGNQQQAGKVDAERHSVGENGFDAKPWIYVDQDHKSRDVLDRGQYSGLQVGEEVCKSGITTGKSCGNVLSKTFSPSYVDNGNDFIQAKYCSEPGDSGAPVYIGNKALGINSGSTAGCGQPSDYAIFGHIEHAQDALNVRVMLAG